MQDNADVPTLEIKPTVTVFAIMGATLYYEAVDIGELDIIRDAGGSGSGYLLEVRKDLDTVILRSRLDGRYNFRKQKGSIIDWIDLDQNQFKNLAISFASEVTCDLYWYDFCNVGA